MVKPVSQYNCKIKSSVCEIKNTVCCVMDFARRECGLSDESLLFYMKVILNELLLNAVLHGNKGQCDKSVTVTVNMNESRSILIEVEDEGCGYDYRLLMDDNYARQPQDICDCKESGRGLMIVRKLSKSVMFSETGNKITVTL